MQVSVIAQRMNDFWKSLSLETFGIDKDDSASYVSR